MFVRVAAWYAALAAAYSVGRSGEFTRGCAMRSGRVRYRDGLLGQCISIAQAALAFLGTLAALVCHAADSPATSAGIGVEVWLPSPSQWNGRVHAFGGNGGAGGSV